MLDWEFLHSLPEGGVLRRGEVVGKLHIKVSLH